MGNESQGPSDGLPDETQIERQEAVTPPPPETSKPHALRRLGKWCRSHKKVSIPLAVLLAAGILAAVPATRYALAGTVVRHTVAVAVIDSQTGQPVSSASVRIGEHTVQTNNKGQASLRLPVGRQVADISKKYYTSTTQPLFVPLFKDTQTSVKLQATGRQVSVKVINKLTGLALANATIKAAGTQVKTDKDGKAAMVLPAAQNKVPATVSLAGYNTAESHVSVPGEAASNAFSLVPAGKAYFLSNASGTIDVVKTNLDGGSRQTVLAGTGKEEGSATTLLASRDWKYLALLSKRDGGEKPKLFLIDTTTDALTTIDEGNVDFGLSGWNNSYFVYTVNRNSYTDAQPKKIALKSFDASTRKITILAESDTEGDASGFAYQTITNPFLVREGNKIIYHVNWYSGGSNFTTAININKTKTIDIVSVGVDGSNKKVLRSFPVVVGQSAFQQLDSVVYAPSEIYYRLGQSQFYEYEAGQVKDVASVSNEKFYGGYPTYLESPSAKHTFWSEPRDGKNTLFVGNADGGEGKTVSSLSEYQTYGWYTDNYLLVSKNGSELYILPNKADVSAKPHKISDYYKPAYIFRGYGGGYGGL